MEIFSIQHPYLLASEMRNTGSQKLTKKKLFYRIFFSFYNLDTHFTVGLLLRFWLGIFVWDFFVDEIQ